ncbi:MAG: hypothetical protein KJ779_05985, partial [Firmicutes bacterium]|nr:hypothetical protein [Bacillota bacterium]
MSQDILENINFITSIISRDNNAWTDLYYAVAPRLRSFIIGRLTQLDKYINIDETANDVVVQTFEKAFNKIDTYKQERSKIKTWIFSIALNLIEDIKRELTKHRSLLNDLKKNFGEKEILKRISGEHAVAGPKKTGEVQMSLFGPKKTDTEIKHEHEKAQDKNWICHTVLTQDDLDNLIKNLKQAKEIAIDTETTGLRPLKDELVGMSFAYNKNEAFYIPLTHEDDSVKQLDLKETLESLKTIFLDNKIGKIFHNAKFDLLVFRQYNIEIKNVNFDTLIAANL